MRKALVGAGLVLAGGMLGACAHHKTAGVMGHAGGPDEFAVARRAPLVIPPDYNLVPPRPGVPRPQEADSSTQALQALFGGEARPSAVEGGVVGQASRTPTTPGIRSEVGSTADTVVDKGQTTRDILAAPAGNGPDATVTAGAASSPAPVSTASPAAPATTGTDAAPTGNAPQ